MSRTSDLVKSLVEGFLDLLDAFARVKATTYLATAIVILLVTIFAAVGPHI